MEGRVGREGKGTRERERERERARELNISGFTTSSQELKEQEKTLQFNISMKVLSLLRYISDHLSV